MTLRSSLLLAGACAGLGLPLAAQTHGPAAATAAVAETYEGRYAELAALAEQPARSVAVHHLELVRDAGRLTLEDGTLYLLGPLGGRTVAAAFAGHGRFAVAVPPGMERDRLEHYLGSRDFTTPLREAVLIFTDSTLQTLETGRSFAPAEVPGALKRRWRSTLDFLSEDRDHRAIDPDVMRDLLNGGASGVFYANFDRDGGDPLMFMLNPFQVEGVQLLGRAKHTGFMRYAEVISQFRRQGDTTAVIGDRRHEADARRYVVEAWLPRSGPADLAFSAATTFDIAADEPIGPWVPFSLYTKLDVDSARWSDGRRAEVAKTHESPTLWVRLDRPLAPAEPRTLTLWYHGNLIDRYSDFFTIHSSASWYPRALDWRSTATFDLTFHSPKDLPFASVGTRVDSSATDRLMTTRWRTEGPARNASFNVGLFETRTFTAEGVPPVTLMTSPRGHQSIMKDLVLRAQSRYGAENLLPTGNVLKPWATGQVGEDLLNSLKFYQHVYGEAPVKQFLATEISDYHGEAFPGLIDLSWVTFLQTDDQGRDEIFRAHEVAHQWWGIAVDFASYRDQWLSEGFADFSGLWYLQAARKDNGKYFGALDRWKADILLHRDDGPIRLGYRTSSTDSPTGYNIVVYKKGAWVLHMLRMMMLDLRTMSEDRFTATMQDFYTSFRGRRASTADFQRVAERHLGVPLDWFFDQWVDGAAIPTYRWASKTEAADGGRYRVRLQVRQENVPDDFQMYVPVTVDLGKGTFMRLRVKVKGPVTEAELPLLPAPPKDIRFNDLSGVLAEVKAEGWK